MGTAHMTYYDPVAKKYKPYTPPEMQSGGDTPAGGSFSTPVLSGLWFSMWPYAGETVSGSTSQYAPGLLKVVRCILSNDAVEYSVEVTTAAGGPTGHLVVYEDTPTGPGALRQSQTFDFATLGLKKSPVEISKGPCWIGVMNGNAAAPNGVLATIVGNNPYSIGQDVDTGGPYSCWYVTNQGTTPPDPFPTTNIYKGSQGPLLYFKAA